MIRFVVGPDRRIVPDLAARLPGRGIWLSASCDVLNSPDAGLKSGRDNQAEHPASGPRDSKRAGNSNGGDRLLARAFARAARGPVTVPPDLPDILRTALIERITASLGLARRAGQAVAGFEKAREMLRTKKARLVMQAADGSQAERIRFLSGLGPGSGQGSAEQRSPGPGLTVIDPLPGETLGRIFGRDYVVHVAVAPGKLADQLVMESGRLAGLTNRSDGATRRSTASVNDVAGTDEDT